MIGFRQLREQPLHFVLFQRHVDLDSSVAGDGGGDARRESSPDSATALRAKSGRAVRAACVRRPAASNPGRRDFHRNAARAEGLGLEAVVCSSSAISAKTAICAGESSRTIGISKRWLSTFCAARCFRIRSNKHPLVRHVLVDDPQVHLDSPRE